MTKIAMRAMWREGICPLLQMHDEMDRSVASKEEGDRTAEIMRDAVKISVPVMVDVKYGKNWATAKNSWDDRNLVLEK